MSDMALHVTRVLHRYGYDYSGSMAVVEEIIQACEVLDLTPEEFDNTLVNYRTQYCIKPSGWQVLAKFRPRRPESCQATRQARNHIFHWIEREGWQGGLDVIYSGVCGSGATQLAEQWGLDSNGPEYAGLPETWRQYFDLLHSGNMYTAYVFMAHSVSTGGYYWQHLARQAESAPEQALISQPYLKRLVASGKVELVTPLRENQVKRKWTIPSGKRNHAGNEPAAGQEEFLFDLEEEREGR